MFYLKMMTRSLMGLNGFSFPGRPGGPAGVPNGIMAVHYVGLPGQLLSKFKHVSRHTDLPRRRQSEMLRQRPSHGGVRRDVVLQAGTETFRLEGCPDCEPLGV